MNQENPRVFLTYTQNLYNFYYETFYLMRMKLSMKLKMMIQENFQRLDPMLGGHWSPFYCNNSFWKINITHIYL